MRTLATVTITVGFLLLLSSFPAQSIAERGESPKTSQAAKVAERWVKLVDAKKYDESWDQAATLFKKAISKDKWRDTVGTVREPLGALKSRTLKSAKYATELPDAPDGEYVVVQFGTSFANKKSAIETITPMRELDGTWRVSGYYIK